jgi:hypothetical protein
MRLFIPAIFGDRVSTIVLTTTQRTGTGPALALPEAGAHPRFKSRIAEVMAPVIHTLAMMTGT